MDQGFLQERFRQPANWQWGAMTNARGADLRYGGSLPEGAPLAHVVYVEGLGEFAEKTFELARDFNQAACGFHVFDRQGQALSGRLLANPGKIHSQGYGPDADDLVQFIRTEIPQDGAPVIILSQSAGVLVTLPALHDNPGLAGGAVLASPLLGLEDSKVKDKEKYWALPLIPRFVREHYVPGTIEGVWSRSDSRSDHKPAEYSSDPDRMLIQDYWPEQENPDLRVVASTIGWVQETCRAMVKIRKPGYLEAIDTPITLVMAGQEIKVNKNYTVSAAARLPHATLIELPDAKHEITMEIDAYRHQLIDAVLDLARKAPRRAPG